MKSPPDPKLKLACIRRGPLASNDSLGNTGAFEFVGPRPTCAPLTVIASDGLGWEHVSVSTSGRTPTWNDMQFVKDLFWDDEEVVIQYHPKKSEYVDCHPNTLHLWKPIGVELPIPPSILVGPRTT